MKHMARLGPALVARDPIRARPGPDRAVCFITDLKHIYTKKICRLKFNKLFEESWTESKIGESLVRFQ